VTDVALPAELKAFLYSCVDSLEQLEIIIRLQASEDAFTARALGRELGLADGFARMHLEILVARGLLKTAVGDEVLYRYAPRSRELQRFGQLLAEWWTHSRSAVGHYVAMHSRSSLRTFAKAFDIRKDQ
jgi:hypothetical protein